MPPHGGPPPEAVTILTKRFFACAALFLFANATSETETEIGNAAATSPYHLTAQRYRRLELECKLGASLSHDPLMEVNPPKGTA